MENASYALRIASGVLIGILVLSLLVAGYYNLRSYINTKENIENQNQYEDFNKQYAIYVKDVYGSDVLSLANKAQDYNLKEAGDKGYSRFDVIVTFTSNITTKINGTTYGFSKGKYTTDQIISRVNALKSKMDEIGEKTYSGYHVSKLAYMRTDEQYAIIKSVEWENAQQNITNYLSLKSDETTIHSKVFKFVKNEYDSITGRMKLIEYKEK